MKKDNYKSSCEELKPNSKVINLKEPNSSIPKNFIKKINNYFYRSIEYSVNQQYKNLHK